MSAPQFWYFCYIHKTDTYVIDSVVHSLDPIQSTTWSVKGFPTELHGINRQKDFWLLHFLQTISFGHTSTQFLNFSQLEMIGGIQRFFSLSQDVPYGQSISHSNFIKYSPFTSIIWLYYQNRFILYNSLIPILSGRLHGSSSQILPLHLSNHKQWWPNNGGHFFGSHCGSLKL